MREAYLTRWSAAETTFGQDKATITGAGNRTSGPVLRSGRPRLVIQEAWAWLRRHPADQGIGGRRAAQRARRRPRPAPQGRRARSPPTRNPSPPPGATPSGPWKHPRSPPRRHWTAIAAAGDSAARAALHTLNVPGRQRHSERKQKARPKFGHATATKQTFTGKPEVTVFAPGFY